MHANKLLHTTFKNASKNIDKRLVKGLFSCVDSAISGAHLSITSLGRYLSGAAKTKHKIKRVDRLFSNNTIQRKVKSFYQDMSSLLINQQMRPILIVDASLLSPCGHYQFLSCSTPLGGRTLPILEEAFRRKDIMKSKTLSVFIERLDSILPSGCKPIVVTDAGFKNSWFKLVSAKGWDYVGRSSSNVQYFNKEGDSWHPINSLYENVTSKAQLLTVTQVSKSTPMKHAIYQYKAKTKGRKKKNINGVNCQTAQSKKYASRAKQPWVLFSSLSADEYLPLDIINIYRKRMQIEEAFRDLKDDRHGLGLVYNRSKNTKKITIALLVGAITRFLLWALGLCARKKNIHYSYQANTIRSRNVLSVFYIARQLLREHNYHHKHKNLWDTLNLSILSDAVQYV